MNKKTLINKISLTTSLSRKNVKLCLDAFSSIILDSLQKGEFVNFSGFGKIYARQLNERKFINFQTGEEFMAPPRLVPAIKFSNQFSDKL